MKSPILTCSPDQQKAIALHEQQPLTRDELLAHFPRLTKHQLSTMLSTPRRTGKIFTGDEGKYQVYSPPPGLKVIKGEPQPYSPPPKLEFIYEIGKFPKEKI